MTAIPKGLLALFSISWFSNGEYHPVFKVLKIIFISTHSNVIYPLKIAKPKISYKKKIMKLTNELDGWTRWGMEAINPLSVHESTTVFSENLILCHGPILVHWVLLTIKTHNSNRISRLCRQEFVVFISFFIPLPTAVVSCYCWDDPRASCW